MMITMSSDMAQCPQGAPEEKHSSVAPLARSIASGASLNSRNQERLGGPTRK